MSSGVQLASGKSEIFEALLKFMPEWVQITVLALVVLVVVISWVVKLKRKIDQRRARRSGVPVMVPSQGSGADHLGPYAPQAAPAQPSGADFLGPYAPQAQAQAQSPAQAGGAPAQPGGADFLGSYAPAQPRQDGSV
ncbi:hypothetical protein ABZZ79_16650 [Streptomyces sp. NPDC006458]|uniref:hypothetical protein n=1 Tax=Streptomyces sp. NPDC006458 TaxID=3154302 RepID=UPI0033BDABE9